MGKGSCPEARIAIETCDSGGRSGRVRIQPLANYYEKTTRFMVEYHHDTESQTAKEEEGGRIW